MKKSFKIIGLYLLFGLVFVVLISAYGGYQNTVVNPTMVSLTLVQYILLMVAVIAFWLPTLIFFLISKTNYFSFEYPKVIILAVLALFICLNMLVIKKKN